MTNSERRISYLPKGINAPGEALPDVEILIRFAKKMNFMGFNFNTTEDIYKEYCLMTKGTNIDISYLNYSRLKNEGTFQWPVPDYGHPGTPVCLPIKNFLHLRKKPFSIFRLRSKILQKHPMMNFPFILTTGRIRDQWHTMTKTGKVSRLMSHIPSPVSKSIRLMPIKAKLKTGDIVVVTSKNGTVRVKAKVSDTIQGRCGFLTDALGKTIGKRLKSYQ